MEINLIRISYNRAFQFVFFKGFDLVVQFERHDDVHRSLEFSVIQPGKDNAVSIHREIGFNVWAFGGGEGSVREIGPQVSSRHGGHTAPYHQKYDYQIFFHAFIIF